MRLLHFIYESNIKVSICDPDLMSKLVVDLKALGIIVKRFSVILLVPVNITDLGQDNCLFTLIALLLVKFQTSLKIFQGF